MTKFISILFIFLWHVISFNKSIAFSTFDQIPYEKISHAIVINVTRPIDTDIYKDSLQHIKSIDTDNDTDFYKDTIAKRSLRGSSKIDMDSDW